MFQLLLKIGGFWNKKVDILARYAPPFSDKCFKCWQDNTQEFKTGWKITFTGQNAGTVLINRPHKKSVKKIVGRALRNEIDVTEVCKYSYPVSPTTA